MRAAPCPPSPPLTFARCHSSDWRNSLSEACFLWKQASSMPAKSASHSSAPSRLFPLAARCVPSSFHNSSRLPRGMARQLRASERVSERASEQAGKGRSTATETRNDDDDYFRPLWPAMSSSPERAERRGRRTDGRTHGRTDERTKGR